MTSITYTNDEYQNKIIYDYAYSHSFNLIDKKKYVIFQTDHAIFFMDKAVCTKKKLYSSPRKKKLYLSQINVINKVNMTYIGKN